MSIILSALKKAEKSRTPTDNTEPSGQFNAIIPEPKKKGLSLSVVLFIICLGLFLTGAAGYFYFFDGLTTLNSIIISKTDSAPIHQNPVNQQQVNQPPIQSSSQIRKEALNFFNEGNFQMSINKWNELAVLTPSDPEVFNNLGVVFKKMGQKEKALESYHRALELQPSYPEALNNLGALLMEQEKENEALQFFEKAIEVKPDYAEPHFHLALSFDKAGKKAEAADQYKIFLTLNRELNQELKVEIETRINTLKSDGVNP